MRNLNVISDYKNVLLAYTKRQNKSLHIKYREILNN